MGASVKTAYGAVPSLRFIAPLLALAWLTAGLGVAGVPGAVDEEYRIRVENRFRGEIAVSRDRGATWLPAGRVIRPNLGFTQETDDKGFTAADWAPDSAVAATAVNAIHLRVAKGVSHAVLFSLQPREFFQKSAADVKSYYSSATSIYTDIPAGRSLFGAEWAPRVADAVRLERESGLLPLPADYRPRPRDRIVILVGRPVRSLREIHVDNREGGSLSVAYDSGERETVARVLRAVRSTGRFGGSQYAGLGRVRANHPGVICVSSAPRGEVGGFQIVPSVHAREPNLAYIWGPAVAAWLIVGPASDGAPPLEGRAPLFAGTLRPADGRCEIRFGGGAWQPLPARVGKLEQGLAGVTELRIRF